MSDGFKNKVCLVTGAASGIGLATGKAFASSGARVVMIDLSAQKLEAARQDVEKAGASAVLPLACDVSKPEEVAHAVEQVMAEYGALDVLVNDAGLMIFKPLVEHTVADWQKILGVDLVGAFLFIQQAFKHMQSGGAIVNVASIHAVETTPLVASYAAAKAALVSLTRSAALEGKPKGIRVNAVLPGAISTPMLWNNPNIKSGLEVIHQSDVGKPEDVALAITYLCSPDAEFIQGASLRVDGGRLAQL